MTSSTHDREMSVSRLIDAPRERVWEAWTDPEHLKHWYGPNGFTITTKKFSFTVGGEWIFTMHGPDGVDYPNIVRYTEIVKPERIRHDHGGAEGEAEFKATITFEEVEASPGDRDRRGKTLVTLHSLFPTAEALRHVVEEYGAVEGGKQTLGRLEEYVSKS